MAFTVKIAGVDKTSLIKTKTLIIDLGADHRDSCRFTIMTRAGTYLPRAGMSVTVEDGGTVFAGLIDSAPQTKVSAEDGASTNITVAVSAKGLYAIPYRRSASESYTSVDAGDIVSDLITSYLAAEGVTAGTITAGAALEAYDTYGKSIGAVLDELANASGYQWYIDNAKALHFVQDIVAPAAAHDIDTSGAFTDFRDVQVDESLDQYRNRQIIRGGIQSDGTSLNYVAEDAAEIAARAVIEGGSGVYEHVHTDTNIVDATNAAAVASNLLKKYGRVQLEISFRSFATDWRPATKLRVNLAAFGISSDRYFLVERVSMQDIGGATLSVTVNGVSKNDSDFSTQMSDRYIDFFAKLLAGQKQTISYTNAVAAGKNKVYFQDAQPTGGTYTPGDTWFDTDDDNRIYEWSGSAWVAVQFGENAIADLAITDAKIANATISNAKISNVDAGKVTTGVLDAARVSIGLTSTYSAGYNPSQKRRVFTATPTTPYDVGDLWSGGPTGDLKKCKTARATGAYTASDWELATKYTDDTTVAGLIASLGDMAYEDAVEASKLGSTVIDGGYIKTGLIDASRIDTGTLNAARIAASSITFDKLATAAVTDITDTIDLGGRNLLKDSDKDVTNSNYNLTNYTWANVSDMVQGEQYTITIEGTLPAGLSWYLNVYAQDPTAYPALATLTDSDKVSANKWVKTVTMPTLASGQTFTGRTNLYQFPLGSGQTVSVTRIKIEKGNKATDWTPAPEDYGALAFEDVVELAKLGSTVIEGGYIKSTLIDADTLRIKKLWAASDVLNFLTYEPYYVWNGQTFAGTQYWTDDADASPASVQHLLLLGDVNKASEESQTIISAVALNSAGTDLGYETNLKIGSMVPTQTGDGNYGYAEFIGNTTSGDGSVMLGAGNSDGSSYFNMNMFYNEFNIWDATGELLELTRASGLKVLGNYVWHAGNDGSGSGLDADTLDTYHASAFAAASHTHSYLPLSGGVLTGGLQLSNASGSTDMLQVGDDDYLSGLTRRNGVTIYANHNEGGFNVRVHSNAASYTDRLIVKADGVTVGAQLNMGSNNIVGSTSDCWITARRIGLGVAANSTYSVDAGTSGYIRAGRYYAGSGSGGLTTQIRAQDLSGNNKIFDFTGGILTGIS